MTLVFLAEPLKNQDAIFDLWGVKSIGEDELSVRMSRQEIAVSERKLKQSSFNLNLSHIGLFLKMSQLVLVCPIVPASRGK